MHRPRLAARAAAITLALAARAQDPQNLVPASMLSTADSRLEVVVWATSPMLRNPTNIDIDAAGRVWVAEGVDYRGHYNRQPAGDRIVVLEDTDGDGRADRQHVFVQEPELRAPMGIAVVGNRVVVSMAPDLIVYTDVDGDGRFDPAKDKREVVLHGFNGRVHDHTVHSVTVGPDGQWYWNAGNAGALFTDRSGRTFRIGSAYDPTYRGGKGDLGWEPTRIAGQASDDGHVWIGGFAARMNPDGSGVHVIGHNFRNSYEQAVTSFGDVFQNDNDDPPACRTAFLMEYGNAGFCSADGQRGWGADRRPGQDIPTAEWRQEDPGTMPAGDVYGGGSPTGIVMAEHNALGPRFQGLLLSCEPGRNTVFGYFPRASGAGFVLERFDFLTSNREGAYAGTDFKGGRNEQRDLKTMFRPSDVAVGPDGAVYVADWYDARVGGHADWDDTTSGTIYRVAPKGFKGRAPKLDFSTAAGAAEGLRSDAVNVRGAAQEALVALARRDTGAAARSVARLLRDPDPVIRARAAWLLPRLGRGGSRLVEPLLKDADERIRTTAFRVLRRGLETAEPPRVADLAGLCARMAADSSAAVRREVALALRDVPADRALPVLSMLAARFDGTDRTYLEALGTGAWGKESALYDLLLAGRKPAPNGALTGPLLWDEPFAWIAWRLHPPQSVAAFKVRALNPQLGDASRKRAVTAIGFNAGNEAADAMLEIAAATSGAVKADALWWLLNRKDTQWKDAGLAAKLKARGVYDPDHVELIEAVAPAADAPKYAVADVVRLRGDLARGAAKFNATCVSCHRVGSTGTEYAPNLTGWAQRQTLEVLVNSVINPSADIASGFNGTEIRTKDGLVIDGLVLSGGDPVVIQSAGGVTQTVPASRIESRKGLGRSLMLSADQLGLSPQDLADIAAWLRMQ